MRNLFVLLTVLMFTSCMEFEEVTFTGVDDVQILSLSSEGVEAEIKAKIKNPNPIGFTIYKSAVNVRLSGIDVGEANLIQKVKVKARSHEAYTFRVKSDFSQLSLMDLPRVLSIVSSKHVEVHLRGDIKAGKMFIKKRIPVDLKEKVPLHMM